MKRIMVTLISLSFVWTSLLAQTSIDKILGEIGKNNTSLAALQKSIEADKIGNKTGVYLQNPEVEFHHLWGNPSSIGNRTDIYITQTFDFPTVYGYKNQIANGRNKQLDLDYQKQRNLLLFQVRMLLVEIIYFNALESLLNTRVLHASSLLKAYKNKLDGGESNILEFNKAQLYLLNLQKKAETNRINRDALLSELIRSNNGISIDFTDTTFQYSEIPPEFDQWYQQAALQIPELNFIKNEIEISRSQQQLSLAQSLPKISAGYMNEMNTNQKLQGITAGVSIPLWENTNTVKFAKAKTIALQSIETDRKAQLYNQLKTYHTKVVRLQKNLADYRSALRSFDNTRILDKALNLGEISLIDYILELSIYYSSVDNLHETEKEMNTAIVELYQYVL